jgi:hypothetical protein
MREGFSVVESLLGESIIQVIAGNQHACCIVDRKEPMAESLREAREMNENKVKPQNAKIVELKCSDGKIVLCHFDILCLYFPG